MIIELEIGEEAARIVRDLLRVHGPNLSPLKAEICDAVATELDAALAGKEGK